MRASHSGIDGRRLTQGLRVPYLASVRLGTTSFIYPAGWLHNVQRLAGRVQDVELLCFEDGSLPDAQEMAGLIAEKQRADLSYTAHTPLSASLASEDAQRRREGIDQVLRVIDHMQALDPFAFIVHVYCGDEEGGARPDDLDAWRERAFTSLNTLLDRGVDNRTLCIESLDYDLKEIAPVVSSLGLNYALDVGHMHRDGRSLMSALTKYLPQTRVIQWHGTADRDHRGLAHYPEADALTLLRTLHAEQYAGVLTLEVFREPDFEESLALVRGWMAQIRV
jgi:sugar phosphate isomerase/epimerase